MFDVGLILHDITTPLEIGGSVFLATGEKLLINR